MPVAARASDEGVTELIVVLWGVLAIGVNTAVGRWCRAHPGRGDTR